MGTARPKIISSKKISKNKIKMKLFMLASVSFGATIKSDCEDGIYRHPENCGAFYQCANGHRYEDQYCPEGLFFNESTSRCDWPENVDCGKCTDGVHPHETDCNAYYQCAHDHRYPTQFCPDNLLFNSDLLVCDWPQNVNCTSGGSAEATTTTTAAPEEEAENSEADSCSDGVHPHESECNAYYQCAHGHRYPTQFCPDNLLFNKNLLVCDWPENVECENDVSA